MTNRKDREPTADQGDSPDLERAAAAVDELLRALAVPLDDPELEGTGARVAQALAEDLLAGYRQDAAEILRGATHSAAPGLVVLRQLPVTTMCPHHLMPAFGEADIAYLPGGKVVGFGAVGDLLDCFSRRLALQEDLGRVVAEALVRHLDARAACCVLKLTPTCMTLRGGRRHGASAITFAWAGRDAETDTFQRQVLAALGNAP